LRALQARYQLSGDLDVATVLRLPDVFGVGEPNGEGTATELVSVIEAAADALGASREEEGTRLVSYLRERLTIIERALESIAARAPRRVVEQRDKLREAVRELTDGVGIDDQRLALEVALLAERLDVQEELSRLASHVAAFRATLGQTAGEPVGKRLGFLLQEMLREANTTGSKANDAGMLADVVTIKEELERLREQVENLE
jgi:uncharacterized protein (TIGR00255 family)